MQTVNYQIEQRSPGTYNVMRRIFIFVNTASRDSSDADFICTATAAIHTAHRAEVAPIFHISDDSGSGYEFGNEVCGLLFGDPSGEVVAAVSKYCGAMISAAHDEDYDRPPQRLVV